MLASTRVEDMGEFVEDAQRTEQPQHDLHADPPVTLLEAPDRVRRYAGAVGELSLVTPAPSLGVRPDAADARAKPGASGAAAKQKAAQRPVFVGENA